MTTMKREIPVQLLVAAGILLLGGGIIGGEYFLVKWYPTHANNVRREVLALLPYKNDGLGIEMKVASGLYGKIESFPSGVRIYSPRFWSLEPSLTITSQPNPDQSSAFTPQVLARWETDGVVHELPRYHFEHTQINGRDAVIITQYSSRAMLLTARVISPDHLVEVNCTPGRDDEDLYMQACDESVRTINLSGAPSPPPQPPVLVEMR